MDQERERIQADLRGLLEGEVRCDDVFVQMYASDASIYEIRPMGVVRPTGTADVVACVQYAAENNLPIHARGSGTGLAGQSLGPGLVVDFSYSMRRIIEVGEDVVRVQPGVVLAQLNRQLAKRGRLFGPDPATRSVTTMGSVISLDGSGSHFLQYGSAHHHVRSLQVVLADGEVLEVSRHDVDAATADPTPRRRELVTRLADLLQREQNALQQDRPQTRINTCGYQVFDALEQGQLDLTRLLTGSEGTLALVTEATLATVPIPQHRGLTLLFFDRLDAAARGAREVVELGVGTCDLMDRRCLSLAREADVRYDLVIPRDAEAMLLVEQSSDDPVELRQRMQHLVHRVEKKRRLAFAHRSTMERDERDLYWRLARRVIPTLYRLKGSTRPLPFIEDIAVPPDVLPDFLVRLQNTLKTHEVTASMFAHAGHGQLHVRPFLDLANTDDRRKMQDLANSVYHEVLEVRGTISGEHGDGLSRTPFVRRQYPQAFDVMREVKRIFDPQNILNPGKVIADAPQPLIKNLRPVAFGEGSSENGSHRAAVPEPAVAPAAPLGSKLPLQLAWTEADMQYEARGCNGCGRCRTQSPGERMCPIFRFAPREEASPRAKANLVRSVLAGRLELSQLEGEQLKQVADLCVNCHQCRLECPAGVDIPKLMVESKAQYVTTNGLPLSDAVMTRLDKLGALGSLISPLANWALGNRQMRWLLEKLLGIAQARKLPRVARRSFTRMAHRRRLTRPTRRSGRKVLLFVDIYANWFDVQLAEALVAVLEHNGVAVYVEPNQHPSGMADISLGALESAKRLAAKNVSVLADAVRQGYHIVTPEPAAALCLTHEYPNLLGDDARLVAEHTTEACTYLWKLHQTGQLELNLKPLHMTLGYHTPCHMRALGAGTPGENLLRLIPGVNVKHIEQGCSGMAGTFGLNRKNFRSSLRAGWGLISALRDPTIQLGTTECSACKLQMEQGTTKPTIHPLKVLAFAYGLMPEVAPLLTARSEELIVT